MDVQELLDAGIVARVDADRSAAGRDLEAAARHLDSAERFAGSDPTGAFVLVYEAARKAIVAQLRAHGLRVRRGPGEHERAGRYAIAARAPEIADHLDAIDEMRRLRHQSEYSARLIRPAELEVGLTHARTVVAAVAGALEP